MKTTTFTNSILSIAGVLFLGTFAANSFAQTSTQEQSSPPSTSQAAPGMHKHGEGPFASLNLTDDQKAQMKQIHEGAKAKADAVMADTSLSDADKQAKVKAIHRATMKQARAILTPEQRQQLKANRRERRAEHSQPQAM
jgi:periplasmic protein CpxP/Spy